MKNTLVQYRYGLLAAVLLSSVALPQFSAAYSARGTDDGTIVVAQNPKEDAKQKGKQKVEKKAPPAKKAPPQKNVQPAPRKEAPKQKSAQPERKELRKEAPKQKSAQPEPKELRKGAPKQKSAQPEPKELRKEAPKQKSVQPQPKELPKQAPQQKSVQPQPKELPKEAPQQKSVQPQPKELPKQAPKQQTGQGQPKGVQPAPKGVVQQQPMPKGNVEQLRAQRHERREANGRVVIEEPGRRAIVRENGHAFIRHDDAERFRRFGNAHEERRGAEIYTTIRRPDGFEIITVTDANGRLLRRIRRGPDRREFILIDNRPRIAGATFFLNIPAPVVTIPRERYIVDVGVAPPTLLYETLEAPPLVPIERAYSLDEIRYNVALRDRMRRVDIDTINFDSGSWEVTQDQYPALQAISDAVMRVVSANPSEVFMIEGHTDAVGQDVDNLSLSDRRAEAVADILSGNFNIPPENLVTQGYGEQFLKVPTQGPNRENRRVTVRRITPLLKGASR
jgi:outer membrane protein OmpA-like peptidoglycan-associated protein